MTDNILTPAGSGTAPSHVVANDSGAGVSASPAMPELPTIGVLRKEGAPGLGVIVLRGFPDAPVDGAITLGRAGANNHSPSISGYASDAGQVSRISMVWIESPAGDTSGFGAVMLQRLNSGPGGASVAWGSLALAANDNAAWVYDLSGVGAIGCAPAVADLATGDTFIAWIGADGHVHGHLYPPAHDPPVHDPPVHDPPVRDPPVHANSAADGAGHAEINATLDDLGPFGVAPDDARRLQVAEPRLGTFAVMWLALAQGGPVLRGSLLVGPTDADHEGHGHSWTQHAIPDVQLPPGFAGPFSIALARQEVEARLEVTCSGPAGTIAFTVPDRDSADSAGAAIQAAVQAATSGLSPFAVGSAGKTAGAPVAPDENATHLDAPADDAMQPAIAGDDSSAVELAAGRAPTAVGVDGGFAIAWVESDGPRETVRGVILDRHGAEVHRIDLSHLHGEAGLAEGTEPTLLDAGRGRFLVSWLQPGADGGYLVMAAAYRETAPGVWLAPGEAVSLKAFSGMPDDYEISVSSGAEGLVINVIWDEGGGGPGDGEAVYSQRYDLDGRQLGDTTKIAQGDAAPGEPHEGDSLATTGLANGQVVVLARQSLGGDHDLFAHLVVTPSVEVHGGGNTGATGMGGSRTFTTRVGEESAIDPLASAPGSGLSISHINGVPITRASPVDVGFGWVQLREDGRLTVTPDAGYRGRIAFDYSAAGMANGQDAQGHVVVDVGASTAPAAVTLLNQVTAVAEDVSTVSALKVADIAMTDGELGMDGLSLTGLDAGMFQIVGNALYLKQGIELDFETKPTLSVEILATHVDRLDGGASFALNVAGAGAAALAAANDMLVFAPGYGETTGDHPLIDLSSIRYGIFQELMDAGALTQEGDNVVITLNPDDPADLQKIVLKGAALAALGDADFKFS